MILNREIFKYQEQVLIERLIISPPFRYEAVFQNEGCFIYIKGADTKFMSAEDNIRIKEEQAVLLNCGTYFVEWLKNTMDTKVEVIAFHLYPDVLKKIYQKELPQTLVDASLKKHIKQVIPDDTISKFIDSLVFYFNTPNLVNEDLLELKIKELILLLIQTKNAESVLDIISFIYTKQSSNIKKIVNLHLYENLTIDKFSKLCNLSPSSFKRAFKSIYNDSPINYINNKKIAKAQELLSATNLSVSEIAYRVGFNDPQYFTRIFKKEVGKTPSVYRTSN